MISINIKKFLDSFMRERDLIWVAFSALAGLVVFGFVFQHLWNWIVVPTLGIFPFSFWQAFGLVMIGSFFQFKYPAPEFFQRTTRRDVVKRIGIEALLLPTLYFVGGYVVHMFIV